MEDQLLKAALTNSAPSLARVAAVDSPTPAANSKPSDQLQNNSAQNA